jgi:3'-phosphoadenosine 5'-phosphosulfate (PAPS) 3'-phosphatase
MIGGPGESLIALARIAAEAGTVIMRHYGTCEARAKDDRSPVTDADEEAEALILKRLAELFPGVPVVAEEMMAAGAAVAAGSHFFLVDPLDGTREFLSGNGEFTVNIAEIRDGVPVMGVVIFVKFIVGKSRVDEDAKATNRTVDGRILREH